MKIKISKQGNLHIERAGKFKVVFCPFQRNETCSDLCPLFNDTRLTANIDKESLLPTLDVPELELCHTTYSNIEVIDER